MKPCPQCLTVYGCWGTVVVQAPILRLSVKCQQKEPSAVSRIRSDPRVTECGAISRKYCRCHQRQTRRWEHRGKDPTVLIDAQPWPPGCRARCAKPSRTQLQPFTDIGTLQESKTHEEQRVAPSNGQRRPTETTGDPENLRTYGRRVHRDLSREHRFVPGRRCSGATRYSLQHQPSQTSQLGPGAGPPSREVRLEPERHHPNFRPLE